MEKENLMVKKGVKEVEENKSDKLMLYKILH